MRRRVRVAGLVVCAAGSLACSPRPDRGTSRASNEAAATNADAATLESSIDASATSADAGEDGDASSQGATAPVHYARVLHIGDSTVGGNGGLAKALKARFAAEGTKYVADTTVSLGIGTFAHSPAFKKLLAAQDPDLVLITLGTNDVFIPSPGSLAGAVHAIAARSQTGRPAGRACIWIGPPTWKPDTGIVDVIRQNAAPCRFFDSSHMVGVTRAGDGIHPTDKGGEAWASLFWTFFRGQPSAAMSVDAGTADADADARP